MSEENVSAVDAGMYDLFRDELTSHLAALERDLVQLEASPSAGTLEALMRASHSIKGAARIIGLSQAVGVAHKMEDFFVAMQEGRAAASPEIVDVLLKATDFYKRLKALGAAEALPWLEGQAAEIAALEAALAGVSAAATADAPPPVPEAAAPAAMVAIGADTGMMDLFKMELEAHLAVLKQAAIILAKGGPADQYEALMRASHSIKGAARIVGLEGMVRLAHAMEDFFGALQEGRLKAPQPPPAVLEKGLAYLHELSGLAPEAMPGWLAQQATRAEQLTAQWRALFSAGAPASATAAPAAPAPVVAPAIPEPEREREESSLLVTTETLNRLTGLAGESWVESRRLGAHVQRLRDLRDRQRAIEKLAQKLSARKESAADIALELRKHVAEATGLLSEAYRGLQRFGFNAEELSARLYNAAIAARMRPLADGLKAFPRMIRDLARQLEKKIRFETMGAATRVDRDVLTKLDAPLTHILRNACDHGIEPIPERLAAGKPEQGTIRVEGSHRGGMLVVAVSDDGHGIDVEKIKAKILQRKMAGPELVARMTQEELLEFLFLLGFSTAAKVSELSGRGVGMDVVQNMVRGIGGQVQIRTVLGKGTTIEMQLPLSLAILRTLIVKVNAQAYAFPLARVAGVRRAAPEEWEEVDGRRVWNQAGRPVPVVALGEALGFTLEHPVGRDWPLVLCGQAEQQVALAVEQIAEEKDVVVHPLDARLGKTPALSAGAILEDGSLALILDTEDLLRLAHKVLVEKAPSLAPAAPAAAAGSQKRVLVVDDSITVREVERRLLERHGYQVVLAVDGQDGWNQVRAARYDLVISDVDMPRMNGIDFVTRIKQDPVLKETPVIIVTYKDREEDRIRGLKAGANYYLTKGSFQDETLIKAVHYLIGEV